MREKWLKFLEEFSENWWAIIWFVLGITHFVLAIILSRNNENDNVIACIAAGLACHARCEIKMLQKKIEEKAP